MKTILNILKKLFCKAHVLIGNIILLFIIILSIILYLSIEFFNFIDINYIEYLYQLLINDNTIINVTENLKKNEINLSQTNIYLYIIEKYINMNGDYVFILQNDVYYIHTKFLQIDIKLIHNYLIDTIIDIINIFIHILNKIYINFIFENKYISYYIIKKDLILGKNNEIYNNNLYINNIIELFSENYKIKLNFIEKNLTNKNYLLINPQKQLNTIEILNNNLIKKYKFINNTVKNLDFYSQQIDFISNGIYKNLSLKHINLLYNSYTNLYYNYYLIGNKFLFISKLSQEEEIEYQLYLIDMDKKKLPILRTMQRREGIDLYRDREMFTRYDRKHFIRTVHGFGNKHVDIFYRTIQNTNLIDKQDQNHPFDVMGRLLFKSVSTLIYPIKYTFDLKGGYKFCIYKIGNISSGFKYKLIGTNINSLKRFYYLHYYNYTFKNYLNLNADLLKIMTRIKDYNEIEILENINELQSYNLIENDHILGKKIKKKLFLNDYNIKKNINKNNIDFLKKIIINGKYKIKNIEKAITHYYSGHKDFPNNYYNCGSNYPLSKMDIKLNLFKNSFKQTINGMNDAFILDNINYGLRRYGMLKTNIYSKMYLIKYFKENIDFEILLKKYYLNSFDTITIKKNNVNLIEKLSYLTSKEIKKFDNKQNGYNFYLKYNQKEFKFILKNIKKDYKIIFLYFNSLYYDLNINEFKINKDLFNSIIDINKKEFIRKINTNLNKNLINYDVYTKMHKNKLIDTENLLIKEEDSIFTKKTILGKGFFFKAGSRDFYKRYVGRYTEVSPIRKVRELQPKRGRIGSYKNLIDLHINGNNFYINNNYLLKTIKYYKNIFVNVLYYIINPKLKIYEINNNRYKYYPIYIFENNENVTMYGTPKNLKFFGGYTYGYQYFQDYNLLDEYNNLNKIGRYTKFSEKNMEAYKAGKRGNMLISAPTGFMRRLYSIADRWLYTLPILHMQYAGFFEYKESFRMFLFLNEYKTNYITVLKIKKYFISSLLSDDIWDLKKFKIKYLPKIIYKYYYNIEIINKLKFKKNLNIIIEQEGSKNIRHSFIKKLYLGRIYKQKVFPYLNIFHRYRISKFFSLYIKYLQNTDKDLYLMKRTKKYSQKYLNIMEKLNDLDFIKYKSKLKYFILDRKTHLGVKDILIRRPKLRDVYLGYPKAKYYRYYKEFVYKIKNDFYKVPSQYKKKAMLRVFTRTRAQYEKTSVKVGLKGYLKFNLYYKAKEPVLLRTFSNKKYRGHEAQKGGLDINFLQILKISKKARYLLNFSKEFNKDRIDKLKNFGIKEFSKDLIYGNKLKYLILEKLKTNKILIKEKHLYIELNNKNILNILYKKYYIILNELNKDNFFNISQIKEKKLEYKKNNFENLYYGKKNYYKKKIFYKKFFGENNYYNINFNKINYNNNSKFYEPETILIIDKEETINYYYKIHFISLNLNILKYLNNFNKITGKNEYYKLLINMYKNEELEYELFFIIKNRKKILINYIIDINMNTQKLIKILNEYIKNSLNFFNNIYVGGLLIIFILIIIYLSLIFFVIILIKSNKPLNNIFGIKTIFKPKIKKEKKNKNTINIENINLKKILEEDITFGTEQKYIYSLTDKKNPGTKIKLYNKYTQKIKIKINKNYEILYKKFIYEENLKKIENNIKLKISFEYFIYFGTFFKNTIERIKYVKLTQKFFNDRFYNYGRFVKTENKELNSEDLQHVIKMPRSIIGKRTTYYLKIIFGALGIGFKFVIRYIALRLHRGFYFQNFRTELIVKKKSLDDIATELKKFFIKIKEKKVLKGYLEKMEFSSLEEPFRKEKIDLDLEISNIELEETYDLYIELLDYLINHKKHNTKEIPILDFICEYLEKKKEIQEKYIEHLYDTFKNIKENKIEIGEGQYDEKLQILKLELQYIDFIIFNALLNIVDDTLLKNKIQKKLELNEILKEIKQIDGQNKNVNLYKLKLEKLVKGKDFRLIKDLSNFKEKNEVLYIIYRYFTTLGSRFYYLGSLIVTLSAIGLNSIHKFRRENYNISSLVKIFIIDIQKYIIKIYGEYLLLHDDLKLIKNINKKIKFLKDIIIFCLIIISPLSIYIFILIILYIFYYYIYLIYVKLNNILQNIKALTYIKYQKKFNNIQIILNLIKFFISCIIFLFKDLKTGNTIFLNIYIYIYTILGNLQLSLFIMKTCYKKGKKEKNKLQGLYNILIGLKLKLYAYISEKKYIKKNKKKYNGIEKINNLQRKKAILFILIRNNYTIKYLNLLIKNAIKDLLYIFFHKYIIIYLDYIIFNYIFMQFKLYIIKKINIYTIKSKIYIKAFFNTIIEKYIYYKNMYKELNTKLEKILFGLQIILLIIFLPLILLIKIYKGLIIKYYDISGYRKKGRFKYSLSMYIDNILRDNIISNKIGTQKERDTKGYFETYLEKKAKYRRSMPKLRAHLDKALSGNFGYRSMKPLFIFGTKIAGGKLHKYLINFKEYQLIYGYTKIYQIESNYLFFDKNIGTKHGSPLKRLLRIRKRLKTLKKKNKKFKVNIKEISRDKFFKRKAKDRRKILRRYFIKGLINGICYILTKKVIFTKIKELKKQKIYIKALKYKKYKYIIANVNISIHITAKLQKVKPQLGFLIILYEYYYNSIMHNYLLKRNPIYHKTPDGPRNLKVKGKINPYYGVFEITELYKIASYRSTPTVKGEYLKNFSQRKPDNLLFHYILYIIEALSGESGSEKKTGHDISAKFGLTYDSINNDLKYEGKEILTEDEDIIKRTAKYDLQSPLLLKRFNEERRLKTAFIFKLACDGTIISTIKNTEKGIDDLEIEKKEAFDYFGYDYNPTGGYEKQHLDLKSDWELTGDNDKYLIHFITIDAIQMYIEKKFDKEDQLIYGELEELLDFVSIIFYDICLVEIINSLNIYINFKKKELLYIEAIDINIEPSIKIPINYAHYYTEEYTKEIGEMELDPYIEYLYTQRLFDKRKIINFDRQIDAEDALIKFDDVKLNFGTFGGRNIIEEDTYESGRSRELFELKYKYQFEEAILQILMEELDIVYTGETIISDKFYEIEEENNNEIILQNIKFLENKWGRIDSGGRDLEKKRQELNDPILYINIMKLSIIQGLHIDIVEKEKLRLFKSNTILFNERYNIYYIDLLPIRIKLPIKLEMDYEETLYMLENFRDGGRSDLLLHPGGLIQPFTKYLMLGQFFRIHLKRNYNRSLQEIFYTNVDKSGSDKETIKLGKKYREYYHALRHLALYTYYIADLVTIVRIGGDGILYHKQGGELEEFTHSDGFIMRLKRQARDGMDIRAQLDYYPGILYLIFNPQYFINIFGGFGKYKLIKYAGILSLLLGFYNIMYCPGEMFVNSYYVLFPIGFGLFCLYMGFYIRKYVNEIPKGKDLYLYKYQAVKNIEIKARDELFKGSEEERSILEHEIGKGNGHEGKVGKTNRLSYVKSKFNTFFTENAMPLLLLGGGGRRLGGEKGRFRKYSGGDYQRRDLNKSENQFGRFSNSYTRKFSKTDVFTRLERGSNIYNNGYVHVFRKNKGLKRGIIDKALYKKERDRFDFLYFFDKKYTIRVNMDISDLCYFYYSMKTNYTVAKLQGQKRASTKNQYDPDDFVGVFRFRKGGATLKRFENKFDTQQAQMRRALKKLFGIKKKYINGSEYYELIEPYSEFIVTAKDRTLKLIIRDRNRYYAHNSKFLYKENIYLIKQKAYNALEPIPFEYLIKISKAEKHLNIMWYNLMKYKYYRHFSLYYNNFEHTKNQLNLILNLNKESILNIKIFYNKIDGGKFLGKLYKLKGYIINGNKGNFIGIKKLQLIGEIFIQKLKNNNNLYETICGFIKIIYPTGEEIGNIIILMIKLFFV